jgi:hypothetical protein
VAELNEQLLIERLSSSSNPDRMEIVKPGQCFQMVAEPATAEFVSGNMLFMPHQEMTRDWRGKWGCRSFDRRKTRLILRRHAARQAGLRIFGSRMRGGEKGFF